MNQVHDLAFPEECYDMYSGSNRVFESTLFRFGYSSLISANSTFDYDMSNKTRTLLKETEVPIP